MRDIWFWQRIVSPHMAGLAQALAALGSRITYIAEQDLSPHRRRLGWVTPALEGVNLRYAHSRVDVQRYVLSASPDSVHLCQGLRSNGLVSYAQQCIAERDLQQWVQMETVDDYGWRGIVRRSVYRALLKRYKIRTTGILAIGYKTSDWLIKRGESLEKIYPFAYFLADRSLPADLDLDKQSPFTFIFVGQFIDRKQFLLLVRALTCLKNCSAELVVVGSGPLEKYWRAEAESRLPGRVRWYGQTSSKEAISIVQDADCLVLPSRFDGWGAVVSEALMGGTKAICSDRCGSAGAVIASTAGGVFRYDDVADLARLLSEAIAAGRPSLVERMALAQWASSLGATQGARYLLEVLSYAEDGGTRPLPPWEHGRLSMIAETHL